jgi:nucleoside-diphosphate-sugar epimerase
MNKADDVMKFDSFVIFGGCGFIGSHVVDLLREKYPDAKIYIADLLADAAQSDGVISYQRVDVRNSIELQGDFGANTLVFNFAAIHRTPGHPDYAYFETNIRGAENVCDFARKHGIENIVFTSSIAPYGAAEELKTEETLPTPNTPYGISKLVAEKIHREWAAENASRRLSIVRPGIVFGKGENGNMTRLYKALKKRKFAYAGRKDTIKACIYVKDLVRVMLAMGEAEGEKTKLYNCCYYPSFTIEQIANTMLKATGMRRRIPFIPRKPMMAAATLCGLFGGLGLGICPARVRKLMVSTNIDSQKLAKDYPLSYSLEDAFRDWFKDCGEEELV